MKLLKKLLILKFLIILSACSSGTTYQSIDNTKLSSTFSAIDQQNLVKTITDKLLNDDYLKNEINGRPTILIDSIQNRSSEHVDVTSMLDSIRVAIVRSRLFSIINRDRANILLEEQKINQAGLTDKDRATELGKLWGAKYVIYGNFSSIVNYVKKEKNTYYKLTITIQNIETGEEFWIEEADLNKVTRR